MDTTYKFSAANREDLAGGRKRPTKRSRSRVIGNPVGEMMIQRDTTKISAPTEEELKKMRQRELQRKRNTV